MKSFLIPFFLLVFLASCSGDEDPSTQTPVEEEVQLNFSKIKEFPSQGRTGAFSFTIGSKIYMGTGFGANATYYGDFWEYDTLTDTWTEKAPFPIGPFIGGNVFVYQGKGYVFAGNTYTCELNVPCTSNYHKAVHAYDPSTDTWEKVAELPDFSGINSGPLAVVDGNRAILVWDYKTFSINLDTFEVTQKSNAPGFVVYSASFQIDKQLYVLCPMDTGKGTKSVFRYDITLDQWETLPDFPGVKRYLAQGFSQDGIGYLVGGKESDFNGEDQHFKEIWQYDPMKKSWTMIGEYPGAAYTGQVLQKVGANVYVGFGDSRSLTSFEKDWWKLQVQ